MKKLQEYLDEKEKHKIKPKVKTPFKDFVEEREDLSFKFDGSTENFFMIEDGKLTYCSETGDYIPILETYSSKDGAVRVVPFESGIYWKYLDETYWNTLYLENSDILTIDEGILEYKSTDNWAKISVSKELLPEEAGLPGLDGKSGKDGKDGVDGKKGSTGKSGKKGDKGDPGTPGVPGRDGKSGEKGIPGKDGVGIDGLPGKDGKAGKSGKSGKDGLNGFDGKDGKDGKDGSKGEAGKDGLNGTDGLSGKDGKKGKDGSDGKDGTNGSDGRAGRVGKTGPKGKDGVDGKDGKDGLTGPKGIPGPPGKATFIKEDVILEEGPAGKDGEDGRDGQDGKDGRDGADGKDGRDGVDGKRGPVGLDGSDGKDAREIEMKSERGAIYWRYVGDPDWDILIDLSKKTEKDKFKDILDKAGIDDNNDKPLNFPQAPMLAGGMRGAPGVAGADGPGVEMQTVDGVIYWRQEGDTEWIFLIDVSIIVPDTPPGEGISISKDGDLLGSGVSSLDFLTDGELTVVNGVATITLGEEMKYTVLLDFVDDGDYIYKGEAVPGSAGANESSAIWRISRTYIDPVTDDIDIMWADGVITFDKIWDNHLTYTYS